MKLALHLGLPLATCCATMTATVIGTGIGTVLGSTPALAGDVTPSTPALGQWLLDPVARTALVENPGQFPGALLGIQCDRNDLRNRRFVFGAVRRRDRSGVLSALNTNSPTFLRISVESQSTYAEFVVGVEGRTTIDYDGAADLVVTYLTPEQYNLVRSARSLTVTTGGRSIWFSGKGSAAATGALACAATPQIVASRVIAAAPRAVPPKAAPAVALPRPLNGPQRPVLTPWSFTPRLLSADAGKGRYLAFTSAVGFAESPLASFNFEIACHGNRLYAAFTGGSVSKSVPRTASDDPARFIAAVNSGANTAEIYRGGKEVVRFPVEVDAAGKGHMLSARELAALLDFNRIVVSNARGSRTIEFTAKGGPQAISSLAEACGTRGS